VKPDLTGLSSPPRELQWYNATHKCEAIESMVANCGPLEEFVVHKRQRSCLTAHSGKARKTARLLVLRDQSHFQNDRTSHSGCFSGSDLRQLKEAYLNIEMLHIDIHRGKSWVSFLFVCHYNKANIRTEFRHIQNTCWLPQATQPASVH
jgi:hypothetical protein